MIRQINIDKTKYYVIVSLLLVLIGVFVYAGWANGNLITGAPVANWNSVEVFGHGESGSVFVRWGRSDTCPDGTEKVYEGVAAGSRYDHTGGGANTLCMSKSPTFEDYNDGNQNGNLLYKVEYEASGKGLDSFLGHHNYEAPCVVCSASAPTFIHWGSKVCPDGWTILYWGYIMSTSYDRQYRGEHVCVDNQAEHIGSSGDENGNLWYPTEAEGNLNAGYTQDREVTCSVCVR